MFSQLKELDNWAIIYHFVAHSLQILMKGILFVCCKIGKCTSDGKGIELIRFPVFLLRSKTWVFMLRLTLNCHCYKELLLSSLPHIKQPCTPVLVPIQCSVVVGDALKFRISRVTSSSDKSFHVRKRKKVVNSADCFTLNFRCWNELRNNLIEKKSHEAVSVKFLWWVDRRINDRMQTKILHDWKQQFWQRWYTTMKVKFKMMMKKTLHYWEVML